MREVIYAMRFTGQATPVGAVGNVLQAATTAPSTIIASSVGPNGLASELQPTDGGEAIFASEVTFTSATSFVESGTIRFGNDHTLRFSTVGAGHLDASADPARKQGTVMWRVDGGDGQFAGASGLITSNFFVGDDLSVTDHHFGVILLP